MSAYTPFQLAVLQLINVVEDNKAQAEGRLAHHAPLTFARDLCTVHANAGRRTGKSDLINKIAGKEDVVIAASGPLRDTVFRYIRDLCYVPGEDTMRFVGRTPKRVFIDEPSLVKMSPDNIYRMFVRPGRPVPTFVFLGE